MRTVAAIKEDVAKSHAATLGRTLIVSRQPLRTLKNPLAASLC